MQRFFTFATCMVLLGAATVQAEYIASFTAEREAYNDTLDKITFTVDGVSTAGSEVAAMEGTWTALGSNASLYTNDTEYWAYYTYILPPAPLPGGPPDAPNSYCGFYSIATAGVDWSRTGEGTNYSDMLSGAWYTQDNSNWIGVGETMAVMYVTKGAGVSYNGEIGVSLYNVGSETKAYEFSLAPVPEPSTFALLACGLIGLLAYAWRKRK